MSETRVKFQHDLEDIEACALAGIDLAINSIDRVVEALIHNDNELAGLVIAADHQIDACYLQVHHDVLSLLALQAPVASDLRLVAALLHVIKHLERIGDQCVNIAKLIVLMGDLDADDATTAILAQITRMGKLSRSQVEQSKQAFISRDVALAEDLVRQDDEIDEINKNCFKLALEIGDDAEQRERAMHLIFVARCFERIGDNAVDIGEQAAFVQTGKFREFQDASTL